jgi:hypothetical protein
MRKEHTFLPSAFIFQTATRSNEEHLNGRFILIHDWVSTHMNYMQNYVFLVESSSHINKKKGIMWSRKGIKAMIVNSSTIYMLGYIFASDIIKVNPRIQKHSKKRKSITNNGTVTGHFFQVLLRL